MNMVTLGPCTTDEDQSTRAHGQFESRLGVANSKRRSLKSDLSDVHCIAQPTASQSCQTACPPTILATLPTA